YILAGAIAPDETFGATLVQPGMVSILPSAIASAEAFGSPALGLFYAISSAGIASAFVAGDLALLPGPVTVSPSGIVSAGAFGATLVQPGAVLIVPATGIGSTEAFGVVALVLGTAYILPLGMGWAGAFGILRASVYWDAGRWFRVGRETREWRVNG
ncbi:MAG: hypothetical protein ACREO2_09115, partial [Arenimonas sp.]